MEITKDVGKALAAVIAVGLLDGIIVRGGASGGFRIKIVRKARATVVVMDKAALAMSHWRIGKQIGTRT